jgi:hypothetical protein
MSRTVDLNYRYPNFIVLPIYQNQLSGFIAWPLAARFYGISRQLPGFNGLGGRKHPVRPSQRVLSSADALLRKEEMGAGQCPGDFRGPTSRLNIMP